MEGTFQPGDRLEVVFASLNELKEGDVILFHDFETGQEIVHRVVNFEINGLRTRGDSNTLLDTGQVTADNFLGLITNYERAGKYRRVRNGKGGLYCIKWLRFRKVILGYFKIIGRGFYSIFRTNQIVQLLWRPKIKQITLSSGENLLVKYLHNGRTVARWWPARHYFECRKPYDLVIPNPEKDKPA
jgi:hypothetical protein